MESETASGGIKTPEKSREGSSENDSSHLTKKKRSSFLGKILRSVRDSGKSKNLKDEDIIKILESVSAKNPLFGEEFPTPTDDQIRAAEEALRQKGIKIDLRQELLAQEKSSLSSNKETKEKIPSNSESLKEEQMIVDVEDTNDNTYLQALKKPKEKISFDDERSILENLPLQDLKKFIEEVQTETFEDLQKYQAKLDILKSNPSAGSAGEIASLNVIVDIKKKDLIDFAKEIEAINKELALLASKKSEESQNSKNDEKPEIPSFLINLEKNEIHIPKITGDDNFMSFVKNIVDFFSFLEKKGDIQKHLKRSSDKKLEYTFHSVKPDDISKSDIIALEQFSKTLRNVALGTFSIPIRPLLGQDFTICSNLTEMVLISLGINKMPRQRAQTEVKHFYLRDIFGEINKSLQTKLAKSIFDKILAFLHRFSKTTNTEFFSSILNIIKIRKDIKLPSLSKEEILKRINVKSLRFYKKYTLKSEWTRVLTNFSNEKDISLERRSHPEFLQRNLGIFLEIQSHNSEYQKNHFEAIKKFLDGRASRLKHLFPSKEFKRKGGNPPLLEDVISDLSITDQFNEVDPIGLILAAQGLNSQAKPIQILVSSHRVGNKIVIRSDSVRQIMNFLDIKNLNIQEKSDDEKYSIIYDILEKARSLSEQIMRR